MLGSASLVRDRAWRQEYFIERDLLETRSGREGVYPVPLVTDWGLGLQLVRGF